MTTLVTGANGTISRHVVAALARTSREPLRTLVRNPDKAPDVADVEVAVGDLERPSTLTDAFSGIDTLWLLTATGPQAPHASSNAVWAAREAGVSHIVRLSAMGATHDAPTRNGRLHALSDNELRTSGIAYTILKPSVFMQNLFGLLHGGTLYHSWGEGRVSLIDTRDIADLAARVLTEPATHAGKTYTITGPASIAMSDIAVTLSNVLECRIAAEKIPADAGVAAMRDAGASEWIAEVIAREYPAALATGWADHTTADFATVTGRTARALTDFAHAYHDQLEGAAEDR